MHIPLTVRKLASKIRPLARTSDPLAFFSLS